MQDSADQAGRPRLEIADRDESDEEQPEQEDGAPDGVEHLVRLAEDLGLSELDVEELVYDMVHRGASSTYNNGASASPELGDLAAFDTVHHDADEEASRINNGGLHTQIKALVKAFGAEATEGLLRESAE
ncbi:MAG: hypothetical protein JO362_19420 [Streptomycetaceae bacterium]|nr:hypothetical protein [Streptomycetaceae bacterium]